MRLQEDTAFQQLLAALHTCAEHALPCLLQTITRWYDTQHSTGALYPFRRSNTTGGTRSQTISAATGQVQSSAFTNGRELLIRSMHIEGSAAAGVSGAAAAASATTESGNFTQGQLPAPGVQELPASSSRLAMSTLARENMAERRDVRLRNDVYLLLVGK